MLWHDRYIRKDEILVHPPGLWPSPRIGGGARGSRGSPLPALEGGKGQLLLSGLSGGDSVISLDFARGAFGGGGLSTRCPGWSEWPVRLSPAAGPLRSPPSRAARARRRPTGATSGRDRPAGREQAPAIGSLRSPALPTCPSPCPPAATNPGRRTPLPARAAERTINTNIRH